MQLKYAYWGKDLQKKITMSGSKDVMGNEEL